MKDVDQILVTGTITHLLDVLKKVAYDMTTDPLDRLNVFRELVHLSVKILLDESDEVEIDDDEIEEVDDLDMAGKPESEDEDEKTG